MKYLLLLIPLGLIVLFIWAMINMRKQVVKDWETLENLEKRAQELPMDKKAVEEFFKEFKEKASKINNTLILPRLKGIEGYLKGVYKGLDK